jgi:hypothetical protein
MRLDQFIFCEHARQEATGQWTLIGFMPGNRMDVAPFLPGVDPSPSSGIALPTFSVVAILDYMHGVTEMEAQCEILKGTELVQRTDASKQRRDNPKARFHTQVFSFMPLLLKGFGDYQFKVIIKVEGRTQSFARKLTLARGTD